MNLTEFINANHYVQGYTLQRPSPELSSFVDFIHYSNFARHYGEKEIQEICFPGFGFNILFPLNGSFKIIINHRKYNITRPVLIPRNYTQVTLQHSNRIILGFKCIFKIWGNISAEKIVQQSEPISLEELIPQKRLHQISMKENIAEKIQEVETLLSEIADHNRKHHYLINHVYSSVQAFSAHLNEKLRVEDLRKELFISSKSLTRYFLRYTGQTPKKIFKAIRFRNAVKTYLQQPAAFDPSLAGYFDHSHFYKEVKSFTGYYPHQLYSKAAKEELSLLNQLYENVTI